MLSDLLDFITTIFSFIYDTIIDTKQGFPGTFATALFISCAFLGILGVKRTISH